MTAITESSLSIQLKRADRTYRENDKVEGTVKINVFRGWSYQSINLIVTGFIYLNPTMSVRSNNNNNSVVSTGLNNNANSSSSSNDNNNIVLKPIQIVNIEKEILTSGKFPEGIKEIPFQFILIPISNQSLIDTYHGVSISVLYTIMIICERGVMKKKLTCDYEFIVQVPFKLYDTMSDYNAKMFNISLDSLQNIDQKLLLTLPNFKISGKIYKTICPITQPFTGEVTVEESSGIINSIELQLVRVESIFIDGKFLKSASEIQNIQIGDGDINHQFILPIYMIFPRVFSCPTINSHTLYRIEFEINLIIIFNDGFTITENFPITIFRD